MTELEYAQAVGAIVVNLQSLEFMIRAFLYEKSFPPHGPLPKESNLNAFKVGDCLPENAMTCYDSLGDLIDSYNSVAPVANKVDKSIVQLRDAFAHGRISGLQGNIDDLHLMKFSQAKNGQVSVTFSQAITMSWLKEQVRRIRTEMKKVGSNVKIQPKG